MTRRSAGLAGSTPQGWSASGGAGRPELVVGSARAGVGAGAGAGGAAALRHLIVWVIVASLVQVIGAVLAAIAHRPRPFGVEIPTDWGGWAMPSLQVMLLAAGLVAILYTLVPENRWRNNGKWLVTGLVALAALSRIALGADAPTDVLVGVALGVTFPLLAFRWFAPNEIFPITYQGAAAPTWMSAAHRDGGPAGPRAARPPRRGGQAVRAGRLGRLHPAADRRRG